MKEVTEEEKKSPNDLVCGKCGGDNVMVLMRIWMNPITDEPVDGPDDPFMEEEWCEDCGLNVDLVSRKDLL